MMIRGFGFSIGFTFLKFTDIFFSQSIGRGPDGPEEILQDPPDGLPSFFRHGVSQLVLQKDVIQVKVLLHGVSSS